MMQDWGAERITHLRDHWRWRPEWSPDRVCFWWYLTLDRHPALDALHHRIGRRLHRSRSVDVIPRRWLHLTVHEVGYADRLPRRGLDQLLATARRVLDGFPRFDLDLGAPTSLPGAVVLPATPTGPVTELRHRLHEATSGFAGDEAPAPHPVPPHVSLAYVNRDTPAREVLSHVDDQPWEPVQVPASTVTLAAVTRRERHYQWAERGGVHLGGA